MGGIMIGTGIGIGLPGSGAGYTGGDAGPTLVGDPEIDASGTRLTLTFSEPLDAGSVPAAGAFALGGTVRTVASLLVTGSKVIGTLSGAVAANAAVNVSYTPGGSPIRDLAGNNAAAFTSQACTNNNNPVAGFSEILDPYQGGIVHSGVERSVDSWTPTGSAATAYSATLTTRPVYESGGFNGYPCVTADGSNDLLEAAASALATAMSGTNVPFVLYSASQFMASSDEALFSLANSAGSNNWMELIAASTGAVVKLFQFDSTSVLGTAATTAANDQLRHVWRVVFDGTLITVERDGVVVLGPVAGYATTGPSSFNRSTLFCLGRGSGRANFTNGRIHKRVWYAGKASETADERTRNYAWMNATFTPLAGQSLLVIEGDSTSRTRDGVDTLDPGSWAGLMSLVSTTYSNRSIGGQTLFSNMLTDQLRDVNSNYASGYARDAVVLMAGLNDYNNARTGAQFVANMQTWITSALAANPGRKIIVCTCPKGANVIGSEDTERLAGNASILANALTWGAHAVYDIDAALPEPTSDTTIFNDGTHWTTLACQRVATGLQAILSGFGFT
jgi:hypothetical protein